MMQTNRFLRRRRFTLRLLGAAAAASTGMLLLPGAQAQAKWPDKTVRIVAAGPAGGSADIIARLLADQLSKQVGQPVIVDPRAGAGGVLAVNELLQAPHDGLTLVVAVNSLVSEIPNIVKLRIDMARSLSPLAELARSGLVLVASPTFPAADVPALVAHAKAHPGTLDYASYSTGTLSHVLGLQLNKAAGIDLNHVGYKGSTAALADLIGGHVLLMFDGLPTSLPLIQANRIRPLAVTTPRRIAQLPQVPTFREIGYPR